MALSLEQQILIEQRVTNESKSPLVAYGLWFFLGLFGAHRFYFGKPFTAIMMLLLNLIGWATTFILIGFGFLGLLGLWWLLDAFLILGMLQSDRDQIREETALRF